MFRTGLEPLPSSQSTAKQVTMYIVHINKLHNILKRKETKNILNEWINEWIIIWFNCISQLFIKKKQNNELLKKYWSLNFNFQSLWDLTFNFFLWCHSIYSGLFYQHNISNMLTVWPLDRAQIEHSTVWYVHNNFFEMHTVWSRQS